MAGSADNNLEYCIWLQAGITDGGHQIAKGIWLKIEEDIDCTRIISGQAQHQLADHYGLSPTVADVLMYIVSVVSTCD